MSNYPKPPGSPDIRHTSHGTNTRTGRSRAASHPAASPPHLHSTRAHSAPSVGRCTGTSWPDLGVRAQLLLRSARVIRQGAWRKGRAQVDGQWRDGWEQLRPPTRLEPAAAGRSARSKETPGKKGGGTHESKGGFEPVPNMLLRSPFFRVPRIKCFVQKVLI